MRKQRQVMLALLTALAGACEKAGTTASDAAVETQDRKSEDKGQSAAASHRPLEQAILADHRPVDFVAAEHQTYKNYGVGPTVDTSERAGSDLNLDLDTASFYLAHAQIDAGSLPPIAAVRVEEFTNAVSSRLRAPDERGIWIEADVVPSPLRPGYAFLRLNVNCAPQEAQPFDVVFAIDQSASIGASDLERAARVVLETRRNLQKLGNDDRVAALGIGPTGKVVGKFGASYKELAEGLRTLTPSAAATPDDYNLGIASALRDQPGRPLHWVVLSTGVLGNPLHGNSVANLARALRARTAPDRPLTVLGLGSDPFDNDTLERIAQAGRGRYDYADRAQAVAQRLVAQLGRPMVGLDPKISVRFDPEGVARYRLVGYESHTPPRPGSTPTMHRSALHAGDSVSVLYEVRPHNAGASWGTVELSYLDPSARSKSPPKRIRGELTELDASETPRDDQTQLVVLSAAVAEKLRQSYWARKLEWEQLKTLYSALPPVQTRRPAVRALGRIIARGAELDRRGDRFEPAFPAASTNFDQLPVLE